jgi:hypothetical protein
MLPKPNRTYSSDDLAILSRVLQEGAERKNRWRGDQRRRASGSRLSPRQGHYGSVHGRGDRSRSTQASSGGEGRGAVTPRLLAYLSATPTEALDQVLGELASRGFSVTTLIGGKLRALYNEAEQPSSPRLNELLRALDDARSGRFAADEPRGTEEASAESILNERS